ncbi:formyltransferase family protein (plasmid) [Aquicoccus sp. G2-2]|uniref:formyltransferase family protein n=1 Tax=Aquicoccus sp. G2-2 TaxID=3092120 RepID=UPI00366BC2F5
MFRVVAFSSGGPGNFATTLNFCATEPEVELVLLVTDRELTPAAALAEDNNIPVLKVKIDGAPDLENQTASKLRTQQCNELLEDLLAFEETGGRIDLIVLAFRKVLIGPILEHFQNRIINVHPSDLSVLSLENQRRRYVGIQGLSLAIQDGNATTRTTVHWVDEGVDTGPIICLGPEVVFLGEANNRADVLAHETKQKTQSDEPALMAALACILTPDVSNASRPASFSPAIRHGDYTIL